MVAARDFRDLGSDELQTRLGDMREQLFKPVRWADTAGPITQVDVDGDGHEDLFLVGAEGAGAERHAVLLRGRGAGRFEVGPPTPLEAVPDVNGRDPGASRSDRPRSDAAARMGGSC